MFGKKRGWTDLRLVDSVSNLFGVVVVVVVVLFFFVFFFWGGEYFLFI